MREYRIREEKRKKQRLRPNTKLKSNMETMDQNPFLHQIK